MPVVIAFLFVVAFAQGSAYGNEVSLPEANETADLPTIRPDGWIIYNNRIDDELPLLGRTTETSNGTKQPDGTCSTEAHTPNPELAHLAEFEEEIAFNPQTCQRTFVRGFLTAADATELSAENLGALRVPSPAGTERSALSESSLLPTRSSDGSTSQVETLRSSNRYYASAHNKTVWVDPVDIDITSYAVQMIWPKDSKNSRYGYIVDGTAASYMFPLDDWRRQKFGPPRLKRIYKWFGPYKLPVGWRAYGQMKYTNVDFQHFLMQTARLYDWLRGALTFPGKNLFHPQTTVDYNALTPTQEWMLTMCGSTNAPAVFKHKLSVRGFYDGSVSYGGGPAGYGPDKATGGCANLVKSRTLRAPGLTPPHTVSNSYPINWAANALSLLTGSVGWKIVEWAFDEVKLTTDETRIQIETATAPPANATIVAPPRVGRVTDCGATEVLEGQFVEGWQEVSDCETAGSLDLSPERVAIRNECGDLSGLDGDLDNTLTLLYDRCEARDVAMAGNKIYVRTTCGAVLVKTGDIHQIWTEVRPCNSAVQIAASGNRLAVMTSCGGVDLLDNGVWRWAILGCGTGKYVALAGNRVGVINVCGGVDVKEGAWNATWARVRPCWNMVSAKGLAMSPNRIGVINECNGIEVTEGPLYGPWIQEIGACDAAVSLSITDNRIIYLSRCGSIHGKQGGLSAGWHGPLADCGTSSALTVACPGSSCSTSTDALQTTIVGHPRPQPISGWTQSGFSYSGSPTNTYECSTNGRAFAACANPSSPVPSLSHGTNNFAVRAVDSLTGATDTTPDEATFTYDGVAPFVAASHPVDGSWVSANSVAIPKFNRQFTGDVNADGTSDMVGFNATSGSWYVSTSNGSDFSEWTLWREGFGAGSQDVALADVTGDKRVDAIAVFGVDRSIYVSPASSNNDRFIGANGKGLKFANSTPGQNSKLLFGDFNFDDRADAIAVDPADGTVRFAMATETATFDAWRTSEADFPSEPDNVMLGDVNKDGRKDLVAFYAATGAWHVALARTSAPGFTAGSSLWRDDFGKTSKEQFVGDVTGDGQADAVAYIDDTANWKVAVSRGTRFSTAAYTSADDHDWFQRFGSHDQDRRSHGFAMGAGSRFIGDVDGDRRDDAVAFYGDQRRVHVALSGENAFYNVGSNAGKSYAINISSEDSTATFRCRLNDAPYAPCESVHELGALQPGDYEFDVIATDPAGNPSPRWTETFTVHHNPPAAEFVGVPSLETTATPTGRVSAPWAVAVKCRVDGGPIFNCNRTSQPLADGTHEIVATARDRWSNETVITRQFQVDARPAYITASSPQGLLNQSEATVEYTAFSPFGVSSVTCAVDGGALMPCPSGTSLESLTEGTHLLHLKMTDNAGSSFSQVLYFSVDTLAPFLHLSGPSDWSPSTPRVRFTAADRSGVARVDCSIDGGSTFVCTDNAQLPTQQPGNHTISATAFDGAGNQSPTESRSFQVGAGGTVSIGSPVNVTGAYSDLAFTTGGFLGALTTSCTIDGGASFPCDNSTSLGPLTEGPHTVAVTANHASGSSATGVSNIFVDLAGPALEIAAPAGSVNSAEIYADFSVSDVSGVASVTCKVNWSQPYACADGDPVRGFSTGSNVLRITATDRIGRISEATSNFYFSLPVNNEAPLVNVSGPNGLIGTNSASVDFEIVASAELSSVTCQLDSAPATSCASGHLYENLPNGKHTLMVRATDILGRIGQSGAAFEVHTTAPFVRVSTPTGLTGVSQPVLRFTSLSAHPAEIESIQCRLDGGPLFPCGEGRRLPVIADGSHVLTIVVVNSLGNSTTVAQPLTVQTKMPEMTITTPLSRIYSTTAVLGYTVTGGTISGVACSIDRSGYLPCAIGQSFDGLQPGTHTLDVRYRDAFNLVGVSSKQFVVERAEQPQIVMSSPAAFEADSQPRVEFAVPNQSAGAVTSRCRIDQGSEFACASNDLLPPLVDGEHTLTLSVVGPTGLSSTHVIEFVVDTIDPVLEIVSPSGGGYSLTPTLSLEFADTTGIAQLNCSIDSASPVSCSDGAPLAEVAAGSHSLSVNAVDRAGNSTVRSSTFQASASNPSVTITAPSGTIGLGGGQTQFSIAASDAIASIECSIDGGALQPCASGAALPTLQTGSHIFRVVATSVNGHVGAAANAFQVIDDDSAPTTTVSSPANFTADQDLVIAFASVDESSSIQTQCRLDAVEWFACSSGHVLTEVDDGDHTLEVAASDASGNESIAIKNFVVDRKAPLVSIAAPIGIGGDSTPRVSVRAADAHLDRILCTIDDSQTFDCTEDRDAGHLADGAHILKAQAIDRAGNFAVAESEFIVSSAGPTILITSPMTESDSANPYLNFTIQSLVEISSTLCSIDGGSWTSCFSGQQLENLAVGRHSLALRATDEAGITREARKEFTLLNPAPTLRIISPVGIILDDNQVIDFATGGPGAIVNTSCAIDNGLPFACTDAMPIVIDSPGEHDLRVTVVDEFGGSATAVSSFVLNVSSPLIVIDSPTGSTSEQPLQIGFTVASNYPVVATECAIDDSEMQPCTSGDPVPTLADGGHSLTVSATNTFGASSTTSVGFTIDSTAPTVSASIFGHQLVEEVQTTTTNSPTMSMSIYDFSDVVTTCALDGVAVDCANRQAQMSGLSDGAHSLSIEATDTAGNVSTTSLQFVVSTSLPTISVTSPVGELPTVDAAVEFVATGFAIAETLCSLDDYYEFPCESGDLLPTLSPGTHRVTVQAVDGLGRTGSEFVTFSVPQAPGAITIHSPIGVTRAGVPALSFSQPSNFEIATGSCSVDGGPEFSCSNGTELPQLGAGPHVINLELESVSGATLSAESRFRVDLTVPDLEIISPSGVYHSNVPNLELDLRDAEGISLTYCYIDGAVFFDCQGLPMPQTTGYHQATVVAVNLRGRFVMKTMSYVVDPNPPAITNVWISGGGEIGDSVYWTPHSRPLFEFWVADDDSYITKTCAIDGGTAFACPRTELPQMADGAHSVQLTAIDRAGNIASKIVTVVVEAHGPNLAIHSPVGSVGTTEPELDFTIDSLAPFGETTCTIDGGTPFVCEDGQQLEGLSEGTHSIHVGFVSVMNVSGGWTSTFTVDTTPPSLELIGPEGVGRIVSPTLDFVAEDPAGINSITCSIDGQPDEPCVDGQVLATQSEGMHTISITAVDNVGNTATSGPHSFEIDTVAPETWFEGSLPETVFSAVDSVTLPFASDAPNATFMCSTGGSDWYLFHSCASPYTWTDLSNQSGGQMIFVMALDAAGNADYSPASIRVVVDDIAPESTIVDGPAQGATITDAVATFDLGANEENVTWHCRMDGGAWSGCTDPYVSSSLSEGAHHFEARATDQLGNADPTPAERDFIVDALAPDTEITTGPTASQTVTTATVDFGFTSPDAGSTFECAVDAGSWSTCTSPFTTASLANGSHTFRVRAIDSFSRADASPAERTFDVATPAISAQVSGSVLLVNGIAGRNDTINVRYHDSGQKFMVNAINFAAAAGSGCVSTGLYTVECPMQGITRVEVRGLSGNDNIDVLGANATSFWTVPVDVFGGDGNDSVSLRGTRDGLNDGPVTGYGEEGNDFFYSYPGPNAIHGGNGTDTVSYTMTRTEGVHVTLDGFANDGGPAELDNVSSDIENINGSFLNDVLIGDADSNSINGFSGDDKLDGALGADQFSGGTNTDTITYENHAIGVNVDLNSTGVVGHAGEGDRIPYADVESLIGSSSNDVLIGTSAANSLSGGAGNDTLTGNSGNDSIDGGSGVDQVSAGGDDDVIYARDSETESTMDCGSGNDTARLDVSDPSLDCETAYRAISAEITTGPANGSISNVATATFGVTISEPGASTECRLDGAAFTACQGSYSTGALADGSHEFSVRGRDLFGALDGSMSTRTFQVDTASPDTSFASGPANNAQIDEPIASYVLQSTEPNSTFECAVDGGSFSACSSSWNTPYLISGAHTVMVRAVDASGNVDPVPAQRTVNVYLMNRLNLAAVTLTPTVDLTAIGTLDWISAQAASPATPARKSSPLTSIGSVALVGNGATSALNSGGSQLFSWSDGASPFASSSGSNTGIVIGGGLGRGVQFTVPASRAAGRVLRVYVGYEKTEAKMNAVGNSTSSGTVGAASSARTNRTYDVSFRGINASDVVTVTWTQNSQALDGKVYFYGAAWFNSADTSNPDTSISSGPAEGSTVTVNRPVFSFGSDEGSVTYYCKLDNGSYNYCAATNYQTPVLAEGVHTMRVRATDKAGNVDPSPVVRTFTVDLP